MNQLLAQMRTEKNKLIVKTIAGAKNRKEAKLRIVLLTGGPILLLALIVNWFTIVYTNVAVSTVLNIIIGAIFVKFVFDLETLELISKEIEKKPD